MKKSKHDFLSHGDRYEFVWFFQSSEGAVAGVHAAPLSKRDASLLQIPAPPDPYAERFELIETRGKVRTILQRLVADNPAPSMAPGLTEGEFHVVELHENYVQPVLVRGSSPSVNMVPLTHPDGERTVLQLRSGAHVQEHGAIPLSCPGDAIPGLVCREGNGKRDEPARQRLAAACRAYERARIACGYDERGHERAEISFANAARLADVPRNAFTRADGLHVVERPSKGSKVSKSVLVTSDDAPEGSGSDRALADVLRLLEKRFSAQRPAITKESSKKSG